MLTRAALLCAVSLSLTSDELSEPGGARGTPTGTGARCSALVLSALTRYSIVAAAFRITTGPGPVPSLDGQNIVIGRVLSGLPVVTAVSRTPTYAPLSSARTWNALAGALGDGRAATARAAWSKPRQAVVITACGLLQE